MDSEKINKEIEEEIEKNSLKIEQNYKYEYPTIELLNENNTLKVKKHDNKELLTMPVNFKKH